MDSGAFLFTSEELFGESYRLFMRDLHGTFIMFSCAHFPDFSFPKWE